MLQETPQSLRDSRLFEMPDCLVVLGNYRQSEFIGDAIRSVRNQSYGKWRCVIVDDHSQDGSVETIDAILREIADERFSFLPLDANGGQMQTMLRGLDSTEHGQFVAFLDADDVLAPEYLHAHLAVHFNGQVPIGVSSSQLAYVDSNKTLFELDCRAAAIRRKAARVERTISFAHGHPIADLDDAQTRALSFEYLTRLNFGWIWGATSAMVFRREMLERLRPSAPEKIRICADNYWAYMAHLLAGTGRIRVPLTAYRSPWRE